MLYALGTRYQFLWGIQFSSVAQSCLTLCDPMNCSTPGLPVHHQLPEFTQTHVHRVRDAIQPSHPRSSPSPPAPNPSQHQTLESPLDCKESQPVYSEGDQPWDFFGRNDAKAETLVLWPLHAKSWLIGKDSDAGRDWGQEKKEMTEDEMAGWHHWLDGHESEWTPGVGDGQGGLACCDSWGRKELDTTEWLSWTELIQWMNICVSIAESFHCWTEITTQHFLLINYILAQNKKLKKIKLKLYGKTIFKCK